MATVYHAKLKISTGQVLYLGGEGTVQIADLPEGATTADDLQDNVLYDYPQQSSELSRSNEIFAIRVEPDNLNSAPIEGQAVVFASPDNI